MTMYHVTYISGPYKVKGYLALPPALTISNEQIQTLLHHHYGVTNLPVTTLSVPWSSKSDTDNSNEDTGSKLQETSIQLQSTEANVHSSFNVANLQSLSTETNIQSSNESKLHPLSTGTSKGSQSSAKSFPALIYCRGGMGKFGQVRTKWVEQFARNGYVVFAPTYRGNEGGQGKDQFGGDDQEDVNSAFRLLQSFPFVQKDRISVMGFSRGAINATLTVPMGVHRLILWSGVSDLSKTYRERPDLRGMLRRVLRGTPTTEPDAYAKRSPIWLAEHIDCPILIIHGTHDQQVSYSQGLHMHEKLLELEKKSDMHTYEGFGHLFPDDIHEMAIRRMFAWMEDALEMSWSSYRS